MARKEAIYPLNFQTADLQIKHDKLEPSSQRDDSVGLY